MAAVDFAALADRLKGVAAAAGADAVGVASAEAFISTEAILRERKALGLHGGMQFTYRNPARATDPARTLPGARALLVAARLYHRSAGPPPAAPAGRVARYSWDDEYRPLRRSLEAVTAALRDDGWQARVLVDDNALVDRAAAHRAGLGWYGKNANVLVPGLGSWVVLGSVVTDAPLPPDPAPVADGCGTCTKCLPACPTGALVGPGVLDARRCLAWLLEAPGDFPLEYRHALGDRLYGCDECQEVCPINRVAVARRSGDPAQPDDEPWVDVVALLDSDDAAALARFARWYVPDRDARYLRRNALVVLGNVGDGQAPDVVRVLRAALAGDDAMLREHAAWAAQRLGRSDLVAVPA